MTWLTLCLSLFSAPQPATSPAGDGQATVVLVVGAEGEPEYGREFARWEDRWRAAAASARAEFVAVGRDSPSATATDKQRLQSVLEARLKVESPARPLWLVLIGHGTFDGREAKFNLRGPDVSAAELAEWLKPCKRPLAVINCASGSAPFLNALSAPDRVVVTATRAGSETNYARFGDYLSAAVADPSADLDKDGQTSLLEAYLAASHRVEEWYKQEGRLASEHALLDDNGDKLGTPANFFQGVRATKAAKDGARLDGTRAGQWVLVLSEAEQAMPPELRARRDALELKVEALRAKKPLTPEAEYYARLEALLLDLARVYEPQPQPQPPEESKGAEDP